MPDPRLRIPICDVPILSAGVGGVARSDGVVAVSAAGGFGIFGDGKGIARVYRAGN